MHGIEYGLIGEEDGRFGRSSTLLDKGKPVVRRGRKAAGLLSIGGSRAAERRDILPIQ